MRFRPPIRRRGDGFVVALGGEERAVVDRLLGELGDLLDDDGEASAVLLDRLFPTVYPDDPEREAEYQRLMRPELVESKKSAIADVRAALADDEHRLDDAELVSLMQGINSVRLVLGTMLGVTDDGDEVADGLESSPEYALYGYLSWLLEWCVRALTGA